VTLNGANPLILPCRTPFVDPGATASDTCEGVLSVTVSGAVDVNTPGDYTLTYTATDSSANSASATRTVQVSECAAFEIICPDPIAVQTDPGECTAVVTFAEPTIIDAVGAVTIVCVPPPGSAFPVGETTVVCTATDSIGQTATCSFTVGVQDGEAPEISCPANITVACLDDVPPTDFAGGSVGDACDPSPTVVHSDDSVSGSNPTIITRRYRATDAAGNDSTCEQIITVTGLPGDLNGDCCIDLADLALLMAQIRGRTGDLAFDINGDGRLDIADARTLALRFTNPGGAPCP